MLAGQQYDPDQFKRDILLILQHRGYPKPWGNRTIQAYDDAVISLTDHMGMVTMVDVKDRANPNKVDEVMYAVAEKATPLMKDHVLRLALEIFDDMHSTA